MRHDDDPPDLDDFECAMVDVVPLAPDPRGRVRSIPRISSTRPAKEPATPPTFEFDDFIAPGVDRRELRNLRRGEYETSSHLDLHRMTVPQACARVDALIESSRRAGHRCVCIVYGRGLNSADGVSVLRAPVRARLAQNKGVLAFATAPPSAGGAGAVRVLLRKYLLGRGQR